VGGVARTLVIGGTSFIGPALVERLLDRGDEVVILHRGQGTRFGGRVGEIACDRNDGAAIRAALEGQRFDVIYDNVYDWQRGTGPEPVVETVLAAGPGLGRYVFTSSVAVYPDGMDHDEQDALVPASHPEPYARNKAETERALFRLHRERGVSVTTIRPAFIYGPENPFPREAWFWDRIVAGRPVLIPGDGLRPMQFVLAADVANAMVLAANAPGASGEAFNLGCVPALTQVEFVGALGRAAGREARLVHVPRERILAAGGRLMEPPLYFGAYLDLPPKTVRADRARALLGYEPTPIEAGFEKTYRWYARQSRPRPDFSWEERLLAAL
jgi:nucleoside-diphosphate-sugar epimerase